MLHKTVGEIAEMPMSEYHSWNLFFEEQEVQKRRAENKAKGIIDFSDPHAGGNLIALVNAGGGPRK